MNQYWNLALIGGAIIGIAVSIMLLTNGRVTGISGIIGGILAPKKGDLQWRIFFVLGLLSGGWLISYLRPSSIGPALSTPTWSVVVAGLLVGFGTMMGSGCTSGHGVCGISRLSPRSLAATIAFMTAGGLAVILFKKWGVMP